MTASIKRGNWRDAATIIIACKDETGQSEFDYKILIFRRTEKTSFQPNNICFPGGVIEKSDESLAWVDYLKSNDVDLSKFQSNPADPFMFHCNEPNTLSRELSLRINAVRETFEEMGILLCRQDNQSDSNFFHHSKHIDIPYWQEKIHNKKITFLEFCKQFQLTPVLTSIHKWNCWMSPIMSHARRFSTATFFIQLENFPPCYPEAKEVQDFQWLSPKAIFEQHRKGQVWIPPPVHIEIHKLLQFKILREVMRYLNLRRNEGLKLNFPVQFNASDGAIVVLPGDDLYPKIPNYIEIVHNQDEYCDLSMEQVNKKFKNLHRFMMSDMLNIKLVIQTENKGKL